MYLCGLRATRLCAPLLPAMRARQGSLGFRIRSKRTTSTCQLTTDDVVGQGRMCSQVWECLESNQQEVSGCKSYRGLLTEVGARCSSVGDVGGGDGSRSSRRLRHLPQSSPPRPRPRGPLHHLHPSPASCPTFTSATSVHSNVKPLTTNGGNGAKWSSQTMTAPPTNCAT